eukprot:m.221581 g.221581  ORF g.221581 m.221581 type:complete len:179 (+) comp32012_c0_seq1:215-751(+)
MQPCTMSKQCRFQTERMQVGEWRSLPVSETDMALAVARILTAPVTRSLPPDWQGDYDQRRARQWLEDRQKEEAMVLLASDCATQDALGLMILHDDRERKGHCMRIGYLLAEHVWGKGLATELLHGFVEWCRKHGVTALIAGVASENGASQRVLEKNGFVKLTNTSQPAADELFYELNF